METPVNGTGGCQGLFIAYKLNRSELNSSLNCRVGIHMFRTNWAPTVLVPLQPIKSWRWRARPMNASCNWVDLLQISSVQFMRSEQTFRVHSVPSMIGTNWAGSRCDTTVQCVSYIARCVSLVLSLYCMLTSASRLCFDFRRFATFAWLYNSTVSVSTARSFDSCFLREAETCKKKVARTRLPIVGFLSWSWFLAVSLQVTWVINPAVGCHYFLPGLQLPPQPLRGLLPILLHGEQRHNNGCEQFA